MTPTETGHPCVEHAAGTCNELRFVRVGSVAFGANYRRWTSHCPLFDNVMTLVLDIAAKTYLVHRLLCSSSPKTPNRNNTLQPWPLQPLVGNQHHIDIRRHQPKILASGPLVSGSVATGSSRKVGGSGSVLTKFSPSDGGKLLMAYIGETVKC